MLQCESQTLAVLEADAFECKLEPGDVLMTQGGASTGPVGARLRV